MILKVFKTSETRGFFLYEWFDNPEKRNNTQIPPDETFFSKRSNNNPRKKDYSDLQNLINGGVTFNEALSKLKLSQRPPIGQENYQNLISVWNKKTCVLSKIFCAGITRMLFQLWKICKRWLIFTTIKKLTC